MSIANQPDQPYHTPLPPPLPNELTRRTPTSVGSLTCWVSCHGFRDDPGRFPDLPVLPCGLPCRRLSYYVTSLPVREKDRVQPRQNGCFS